MRTKSTLVIALGVSLFTISACKKKSDPTPTPTPTTSGSYYIEGKVNGVMHKATYVCPYAGCSQNAGNFSDFMETITMQRTTSSTNDIGWDIHISNVTSLESWQLPDTLDASTYSGVVNLDLSYYKGPWQSSNNYLVDQALGDSSFKMIVTSKAGDVIQGTFSGTLRNGDSYSDTVKVTEGRFKIKLARI